MIPVNTGMSASVLKFGSFAETIRMTTSTKNEATIAAPAIFPGLSCTEPNARPLRPGAPGTAAWWRLIHNTGLARANEIVPNRALGSKPGLPRPVI